MPRIAPDPFFPKTFLTGVSEGKTVKEYSRDKRVFEQHDQCDAIFYLERGKVKLTVTSEQGKEAVVALLNDGEFFGEGCLAGQTVRMATALTIEDSTVIRIEKAAMVRALRDRPEFSEKFMA